MRNSAAKKRKRAPIGYLVVGMDPHKKKPAAVFMTQDFMTRSKLKFDNSREGFETVVERARTEMLKTGCHGAIFAIEMGAHHWRNLPCFLDEKGFPRRLINQFTLKRSETVQMVLTQRKLIRFGRLTPRKLWAKNCL